MDNAILEEAVAMGRRHAPENLALEVIFSHRREDLVTQFNEILLAQRVQRDEELAAARIRQENAYQAQRNTENALGIANRELAALAQIGEQNEFLIEFARQRDEERIMAEARQQVSDEGNQELANQLWDLHLEIADLKRQITAKDDQIVGLQRGYDQEQGAHQQTREMLEQEHHRAEQVSEQLATELEALKTSEKRSQAGAKMYGDDFQQIFFLEKKLNEAKGENEAATERMWALSNEGNALAEKLLRWRKRARKYKAALRVQKMRGLVFRKTMRAKIRHLVIMRGKAPG